MNPNRGPPPLTRKFLYCSLNLLLNRTFTVVDELLSEVTKTMTGFTNEGGESGARSEGSRAGSAADDVRQAFAGLPLEEKISTLIRIELDMLGDAVGSVVSAVSTAVDDIAKACECSEQSASATPDSGGQAATS